MNSFDETLWEELSRLDEDEESFDSRFDKEFGTGTDVFSFDEYLERMRRMAEFK